MPSTFAWLDHSEEQRRQMLDVLGLFREKSTVDELGLGTIRDAIADLLFPGTSAPQTRARYFLFVPWIYLRLERQRVSSSEIAARARRAELDLIERLLAAGESEGVIGRLARRDLQRLPSGIYWTGLRALGICRVDGSPDFYHQSLDAFYHHVRHAVRTDDRELVVAATTNWHAALPSPPSDFPNTATLALTREEADYLRERLAHRATGTLFEHIVTRTRAIDCGVEFPWEHPRYAEFSTAVREQLKHARNVSEVMHGANLLYNLCLAQLIHRAELVDDYRSRLQDWARDLTQRTAELQSWGREAFWRCITAQGARIPYGTRLFVEQWWAIVIDRQKAAAVADDRAARTLIAERERKLKGPLARMFNARARERWGYEAGTGRLSYRWPNAQRLSRDILEALERPDA
jgi:hypothetical protein